MSKAVLPRPHLVTFSLDWYWSATRGWSTVPSTAVRITISAERRNDFLIVHTVSFSPDGPWRQTLPTVRPRFRARLRDVLQELVPPGLIVHSIPKEAIDG